MIFQQKLDKIVKENNSLLCVGLDPVLEKLPKHLLKTRYSFFEFNKQIIDATYDLVCCYKPNSAFYEALGEKGIGELKKTCDYIKKNYPEIPIILDAKRADIESTNDGYVTYSFDYLGVDAITLHPYLGKKALEPFLQRKDKACIILCRTSNPGASEFQDLVVNGKTLYKKIAEEVWKKWNTNNNCLLVVGATYPKELAEIRKIVGNMTLLVPGIGTQGGRVEQTVKAGLNSKKAGMIISSSRDIIFASSGEDFAQKSREKALAIRDTIQEYRI